MQKFPNLNSYIGPCSESIETFTGLTPIFVIPVSPAPPRMALAGLLVTWSWLISLMVVGSKGPVGFKARRPAKIPWGKLAGRGRLTDTGGEG